MARSATRPRSRERERKQKVCRERPPATRFFEYNGKFYEFTWRDPIAAAHHEAGHCVVAHALGWSGCSVTIRAEFVPPDECGGLAVLKHGSFSYDTRQHREVNAREDAGLPFTAEQKQWLVEEAVILVAGPLAELNSGASNGENHESDAGPFWENALKLGKTEERDGKTVSSKDWFYAVQDCADTILQDCWTVVEGLAERLLEVGQMDEKACREQLRSWPSGSHAHLLSDL